eukprot:TRINITY_DN6076_c0_g2_i8.p1 TRINITY_DN6076_c0_g2~~TRINITY_DN6076_c0_g2_i8.p1  ORF type:complete len:197 (-),score=6.41 TRINITY_DN6076_c0_g2_i8:306-896(-)
MGIPTTVLLIVVSSLSIVKAQNIQEFFPDNYEQLSLATQAEIRAALVNIQGQKSNATKEYTEKFNSWSSGEFQVNNYRYTIERVLKPALDEKPFTVTVCNKVGNQTDNLGGVNTIDKVFTILKGDIDSLGKLGDNITVIYDQQYSFPSYYVRSTSDILYDFTNDGKEFQRITGPVERGYNITNFQDLGLFSQDCLI